MKRLLTPDVTTTLLCFTLMTAGLFSQDPGFSFREVAKESGVEFRHVCGDPDKKTLLVEAKGAGAGFFDYDGDGWLDLLMVQGSTIEEFRRAAGPACALFRNTGKGSFSDVTAKAGLSSASWGVGVAVADYDNDGFPDIYLTCFGPNILYRNNGDGTFTDVTRSAGLDDDRWSSSAAFGDYDLDGDLDLYVCNYVSLDLDNPPSADCRYLGHLTVCGPRGLPGSADALYRNNSDGTFTEVSRSTGTEDVDLRYGLGVVWTDIDDNRWPDLYVANDFGPNLLYLNQGNGRFSEEAFLSGLAFSGDGLPQAGMGVDAADFDNDGLIDVFVTHFASDYSTLYQNRRNLMFEDITGKAKIQTAEWFLVSWGTRFGDFDHDGWKDIFHSNGHVYPFLREVQLSEKYDQASTLFLNLRDGTFAEVSQFVGLTSVTPKASRGVAFGDYDNDGDMDCAVANLNDSPFLLRNDRRNANHWVMFRTRGTTSNRDGIGARIMVKTDKLEQIWEIKRSVGIFSVSDPRAHFGLGRSERVQLVTVLWPSGKRQEFKDVKADLHYLIDEKLGLLPEPIRLIE